MLYSASYISRTTLVKILSTKCNCILPCVPKAYTSFRKGTYGCSTVLSVRMLMQLFIFVGGHDNLRLYYHAVLACWQALATSARAYAQCERSDARITCNTIMVCIKKQAGYHVRLYTIHIGLIPSNWRTLSAIWDQFDSTRAATHPAVIQYVCNNTNRTSMTYWNQANIVNRWPLRIW